MNNRIAMDWIKALRSGEYKQGKVYLNSDNKFCCLGVLSDLYLKEHGKEWQDEGHFKRVAAFACGLDREVMDWAGLEKMDVVGHYSYEKKSLATLNDSDTCFNEIADIIEIDWEEM